MKSHSVINRCYFYLIILGITGAAIFLAVKNLFFFDEDIFVAGNNNFMQDVWQRSFIVKLTFIANSFISGKNAAGYHYTNLVLHLANALLALFVFKELLKSVANYLNQFQLTVIPFIFLMVFLITPIHSEPLCYLLARCSTVVTLFCLISILLFLKAAQKNKLLIFLSLLSFLLALFSYEISWMLPFIILSIVIFTAYVKGESVKKNSWIVTPYFFIFAAWFVIKIIIVNKMEVSDYKDDNLFSISFTTLVKNTAILFLRNFIPPFKSTVVFVTGSIGFIIFLLSALIILFKKQRKIFYFLMLLLVNTAFGFAAAVVFGIDSHDSESERYIYFSSVFALMLLSVLLVMLIKNKLLLLIVIGALCSFYAYSLFKTINYYKAAGNFSKNYLQTIDKKLKTGDALLFVNMRSQFNGALMFRAKSRMAGNTNDKVSIIQEYLSYLYAKNNTCFTLSAKELTSVPQHLILYEKPVDSIAVYFPEVKFNKQNFEISVEENNKYSFKQNNTAVIALKDSAVYIFR
ncbi:hypothetical protein [Ferruginibacter sp.]